MNRRPSRRTRLGGAVSFRAEEPDATFFDPQRTQKPLLWLLPLMVILLLLLCNAAVNAFVRCERVTVPLSGLPSQLDGLTILQISDLKGAEFGHGQSRIAAALAGEAFDVVLLTGDMVSDLGNAQPLYALIDVLRGLRPDAPIYFIAGDADPEVASMDNAASGSPFASWVLGAQQHGATLLSAPMRLYEGAPSLWLSASTDLLMDYDAQQARFERLYLEALGSGNEAAIALAEFHLDRLERTRQAKASMRASDLHIAVTHVPPEAENREAFSAPFGRSVALLLAGHTLGGLLRLPFIGPVFLPSGNLPRYGLFPGQQAASGLVRRGASWLYVSAGLGSRDTAYPSFFFRLCNPPSVTLLRLEASRL